MSKTMTIKQKLINEMKQMEIEMEKKRTEFEIEMEKKRTEFEIEMEKKRTEFEIEIKKITPEVGTNSDTAPDSAVELDTDLDKMKRLVDSWSKPDNNTQIAQLFIEMIDNGGSMLNDRVKEIYRRGEIHQLTDKDMEWNTVFAKDKTKHYIRLDAIDYFHEN